LGARRREARFFGVRCISELARGRSVNYILRADVFLISVPHRIATAREGRSLSVRPLWEHRYARLANLRHGA
jgi:hypothetical protein